jgi:hypothetical protein
LYKSFTKERKLLFIPRLAASSKSSFSLPLGLADFARWNIKGNGKTGWQGSNVNGRS